MAGPPDRTWPSKWLAVGSNKFSPPPPWGGAPGLREPARSDRLAGGRECCSTTSCPRIEAFDLSHIHQAAAMYRDGRLQGKCYVQFVMGVKKRHARRPRRLRLLRPDGFERLVPGGGGMVCGREYGRHQLEVNEWLHHGGRGTRGRGWQDNVKLDRQTPSRRRTRRWSSGSSSSCGKYERPVATWRQAREILGLRMRSSPERSETA